MNSKLFWLASAFLILQGCAYKVFTTKLDSPIERPSLLEKYRSSIDLQEGKVLTASIGDELFVINRVLSGAVEIVKPFAPTGNQFPQGAKWVGTHQYDDGSSPKYVVYTTPTYYKGTIGVILDENGYMKTRYPLVQVEGMKKGRRWRIDGNKKFFVIPESNIDSWALRYGGKKDGNHVFEIINKHQSDTSEILQTIFIDDQKFNSGFVIRKVLIDGAGFDEKGVISFKIVDTFKPDF